MFAKNFGEREKYFNLQNYLYIIKLIYYFLIKTEINKKTRKTHTLIAIKIVKSSQIKLKQAFTR